MYGLTFFMHFEKKLQKPCINFHNVYPAVCLQVTASKLSDQFLTHYGRATLNYVKPFWCRFS